MQGNSTDRQESGCDPTEGLCSHPPLPPSSGPSGNLKEATMSQATTCLKVSLHPYPPVQATPSFCQDLTLYI